MTGHRGISRHQSLATVLDGKFLIELFWLWDRIDQLCELQLGIGTLLTNWRVTLGRGKKDAWVYSRVAYWRPSVHARDIPLRKGEGTKINEVFPCLNINLRVLRVFEPWWKKGIWLLTKSAASDHQTTIKSFCRVDKTAKSRLRAEALKCAPWASLWGRREAQRFTKGFYVWISYLLIFTEKMLNNFFRSKLWIQFPLKLIKRRAYESNWNHGITVRNNFYDLLIFFYAGDNYSYNRSGTVDWNTHHYYRSCNRL